MSQKYGRNQWQMHVSRGAVLAATILCAGAGAAHSSVATTSKTLDLACAERVPTVDSFEDPWENDLRVLLELIAWFLGMPDAGSQVISPATEAAIVAFINEVSTAEVPTSSSQQDIDTALANIAAARAINATHAADMPATLSQSLEASLTDLVSRIESASITRAGEA